MINARKGDGESVETNSLNEEEPQTRESTDKASADPLELTKKTEHTDDASESTVVDTNVSATETENNDMQDRQEDSCIKVRCC